MYGMVLKQPVGVCGAIVPWNFPITLMGTKVGPALAAGCTIVVKPAGTTPLAALRIIELMNQVGFPKGVLNIVTGPGGVVGEELLRNSKVRRIAFTGATNTGQHVVEVAGREMKRITLELGGSDPMIVCEDADIDKALTGASVGRFYNCGQACLAVKRLYVVESVYDDFVQKLIGKVQRLTVGNGMDKNTRIGPMHTKAQREEIEGQIADAVKKGAKANSSQYGLGSSVWTRDLAKARKAADRIQAGNVWINSLHIGYDEMPFGGVKYSGFGREHGPEALEYYLETKGVVIGT
jgi:succinate-semialdehyde dehydrogenase/glutarate-semialdehyde dehydrogenase